MPYVERTCTSCGEKLGPMIKNVYLYGSPIRSCKYCGAKYLDKNYHEIAIDGINEEDLSAGKRLKMLLLCVVCSVILAALNVVTYLESGLQPALVVVFACTAGGAVVSLWKYIQVVSGGKQKQLDKERQASVERLQDKEYAAVLQKLGYEVPEEFL